MFGYIKDLGLKPARPYTKRKKTDAIVLHHFAGNASPQAVHANAINGKGHKGIGYNIVVQLDGTVVWGRGLEFEGGHTQNKYGYNARSIGIACQGNFETNRMGDAQKAALLRVIADCLKAYPGIKEIVPHKHVSATLCPGKYFPLAEAQALLHKAPAPAPAPAGNTYTVKAGDTLFKIAKSYRTTVGELAKLNGIFNVAFIKVGQVLKLPGGVPAWNVGRLLKLVKPMMAGGDVEDVQAALKGAGFEPGKIDGIFGDKTKAAVIAYQKAKGLKVDGIVGRQTVAALGGNWKA